MGKPKRLNAPLPKWRTSDSLSIEAEDSSLNPQVGMQPTSAASRPRTPVAAAHTSSRFEDLPSIAIPSDAARPAKPRVAVSTEPDTPEDEVEGTRLESVPFLHNMYKGLPSWMSSMAFHMALIVLLALLAIGDNNKNGTVNLTAVTVESEEPILALNKIFEDTEESEQDLLDDTEELVAEETELEPDFSLEQMQVEAPELEADLFGASDELTKVAGDGEKGTPQPKGKKEGAKFFGVSGEGNDFVFIIDASGSMADYGRWARAVDELTTSINGLSSSQNFLVLLYNNSYVSMNKPAKMISATPKAQKEAVQWVSQRFPDGWTFCADAVVAALKQRPDAIFLLSDGEFTDRSRVLGSLRRFNQKGGEGGQTPVHTIALGSHTGKYTMKHIAENNNGIFTLITD